MSLLYMWKNKILSLKEKIVFSILLAQSLMFAGSAQAQTSSGGLFTPSSGDISVMMLSKLFGGLVGNGGADPLKDLISTFNGAILAIGGILVAYTIFAGTIGTAHDGEMLGKKFSSVWVPIRTALGTALVIPVNGYCGMQMLVMWLVLQGIGLADTVWASLVQGNALTTGVINNASVKTPEITNLANAMLKASVCLRANTLNESTFDLGSRATWTRYQVGNQLNYGVEGSVFSSTSCGVVNLLDENLPPEVTYTGSEFGSIAETVGKTKDNIEIIKAHNAAALEMASYMDSVAQNLVILQKTGNSDQVVSNVAAYPPNSLTEATKNYNTKVTQAVLAYYASNDKDGQSIKDNAARDGWIMAGAWFIKLSSQMSKATQALSTTPKGSANDSITSLSQKYADVNKVLANTDLMLAKDTMNQKNGVAQQNSSDGSGVSGIWSKFARFLGEFATGIDIAKLGDSTSVHPIIQMKQMGDEMVSGSLAFIGGLIGIWAGLGTIFGNAGMKLMGADIGFLSAAMFISPIAFTMFGGMLTLGFFLAYYIPMIPFLIWLGCLVGWFIMVMEAIIAAPLWAVMHLHPNGDDVTGRGGQGYMLVLGLLVRPTLMIFGLACALILSMVLGQFINSIFYDVFRMSRAGDGIGFFGTLLAYALYTTMMITFVQKMFSIIHVIPDQLLQWIGGGGPQLGGYAGQMVQGTEGQFMKAGGLAGALGQQGLQSGLGSMQRRAQMGNDNRLAKDRSHSEAARGVGMTTDQLSSLAAGQKDEKGQSMDGPKAAAKMQEAQQQLQSAGATGGDLNSFAANVNQNRSEGKTLGQSISDAKNDFYNNKFGGGAAGIVNGASGGDPVRERVAAGKLASAQGSMGAEGFSSYMSDVQSAVANPSAALSGGVAFKNEGVTSALQSYSASHGNGLTSENTSKAYATAINGVAQAYKAESQPSSGPSFNIPDPGTQDKGM